MNSPESVVNAFIEAHYEWNNRSDERNSKAIHNDNLYDQMMDTAKKEYQAILKRLCSQSVVAQPISFTDNPIHDPKNEKIESVESQGTIALVRTRNIRTLGPSVSFEYHLVQENSEWRIASLLYVDDVGADECL
jgi:hypothetical protein